MPIGHLARLFFVALLFVLVGCDSHHRPLISTTQAIANAAASGLAAPAADHDVMSIVTPPLGWKPDPLKTTDKSRHRVWLSPTGATAFGVIYFDLPWPVGSNLALSGFMDQMKQTQGEGNLLSRKDDADLPGIRFVAEDVRYTIRCCLTTSGFHGWVWYAGTLRDRPVNDAELKTAEQAREQTRVDAQ